MCAMATARGRATVRPCVCLWSIGTQQLSSSGVLLCCVVLYCVVLCYALLCFAKGAGQGVVRRKKANSHFVGRRLSLVITWCRWPQLHPYPPGVPMNTAQPQCFPASEAPAIVGVGWDGDGCRQTAVVTVEGART